jgi:hypothetical protein
MADRRAVAPAMVGRHVSAAATAARREGGPAMVGRPAGQAVADPMVADPAVVTRAAVARTGAAGRDRVPSRVGGRPTADYLL